AHRSQLDPEALEPGGRVAPATYLTHPDFRAEVEARARSFGALIGARFGEGYRMRGPVAIQDARVLLGAAAGVACSAGGRRRGAGAASRRRRPYTAAAVSRRRGAARRRIRPGRRR